MTDNSELIERLGKLQDSCNKQELGLLDTDYVWELAGRTADEIERLRKINSERTASKSALLQEGAKLESRIEQLEAVVQCEWDIVGALEQTVSAVPEHGNAAIIGVARNAVKHHKKALAALEEK